MKKPGVKHQKVTGTLIIMHRKGVNGRELSKLVGKTIWAEKTKRGTNTTGCELYTDAKGGFSHEDCLKIAKSLNLQYNGSCITSEEQK